MMCIVAIICQLMLCCSMSCYIYNATTVMVGTLLSCIAQRKSGSNYGSTLHFPGSAVPISHLITTFSVVALFLA